jgi:RimJ/RimL family protein N-acetyltransferase
MAYSIPDETIRAFARTIHNEAQRYGFSQVDTIRLINALMDQSTESRGNPDTSEKSSKRPELDPRFLVDTFPITSADLSIRAIDENLDRPLMETWIQDEYGKHFLLSCSAARQNDIDSLLASESSTVGIIELKSGKPIGAIAYLDVDTGQRRAELRKLIGAPEERGKGYAEQATSLWLAYGIQVLNLEKVYVSTLQTHLRNIRLNESVGFNTEGVLRSEVFLEGKRHDVLRMGYCAANS